MSQTTVNLGHVPVNRGEYNATSTYYKDNIVQYNGSSYICNVVEEDVSAPVGITGVAPYDDDPTRPNEGWKVFASDSAYCSQFFTYKENPEFCYVIVDKDKKILFGFKWNGEPYFGIGCPQQVKDYIEERIAELDKYEDIVNFLGDLVNSGTLQELLDAKADKEEGKSLIDAEYASSQSTIDNPEFIEAKTDSEGKLLEARKVDGTKVEYCDLQVEGNVINEGIQEQIDTAIQDMQEEVEEVLGPAKETLLCFKSVDNPEWIQVTTDAEGKILEGITSEGKKMMMMETEMPGGLDGLDELIDEKIEAEIPTIITRLNSIHTLTIGNQNVRTFQDEGVSGDDGGSDDPNTYLPLWKEQISKFLNQDFLTIIEWRDYFDHDNTINTYDTLLRQFYPYHFEISNNKGLFSKIPCVFERKVRNYEYIIGKTNINGKSLAVVSWVQGNLDDEEKVRNDSQWMINQLSSFDLVVVAGDFNNEQGPQLLQVWLDNGYTLGNCGYWGEISTCTDSAFDHSSNDNIVTRGFIYDNFEKGDERLGSDHYPVKSKLRYI